MSILFYDYPYQFIAACYLLAVAIAVSAGLWANRRNRSMTTQKVVAGFIVLATVGAVYATYAVYHFINTPTPYVPHDSTIPFLNDPLPNPPASRGYKS